MDDHDAATPAGDPTDQLWIVATVGRLAGQGLLERPAESTDSIAVVGQRLLIAAGLLDADPFGPGERLRSLLPAGAPLTAISWFVRELLAALIYYVRPHPFGAVEWSPIPGITDQWRLAANRASASFACSDGCSRVSGSQAEV